MADFEQGGKYAKYKGLSWTEFLVLVALDELDIDEAEQIYYEQYHEPAPQPPPKNNGVKRQAGCACDDLDKKIIEYRRLRDEKKRQKEKEEEEERKAGYHSIPRHYRLRYYADGRPYWRHRRYGWVPLYGLSYRQMLAYGLSASLAKTVRLMYQ